MKSLVDKSLKDYQNKGLVALVESLNEEILSKKVKFPLLEYASHLYFEGIEDDEQITFCDLLESKKREGGNVILGIMLQNRMDFHYKESIRKTTEYVSQAHIWYICDIIGERVYGHALLHHFSKAIKDYEKLIHHKTHWVVRSLGAGAHLAVKWGLDQEGVRKVFKILLIAANFKDKEIRQGIGWAAKTTAKFHPEIIQEFRDEIDDKEKVANWFRTKVRIGLERNEYLKLNRPSY